MVIKRNFVVCKGGGDYLGVKRRNGIRYDTEKGGYDKEYLRFYPLVEVFKDDSRMK